MKKILILNTIGMGYEGISSVIMNYLKYMDKDGLEIKVVAFDDTKKEFLQMLTNETNVVVMPNRKNDFFKYLKKMYCELNTGYDVFHIHGNSGTMLIEVVLGKMCNVKKILTHVHNTKCNHPIINKIFKIPMNLLVDKRIACSTESGMYLYDNKNFTVLNNAIDLDKYSFDTKKRQKIRLSLNLNDEFILGHSGSFIEQKNHKFLIEIFYEFQKLLKNSKLILLSDGPEYQSIKNLVEKKHLNDKVLFLGRRSDAYLYYQAMDCFVLPSKWEGLPLVALEAQASNLPVYISDNVTNEVMCCSKTKFISLKNSPKIWADLIFKDYLINTKRLIGVNKEMKNGKFDINSEAIRLRNMYLGE